MFARLIYTMGLMVAFTLRLSRSILFNGLKHNDDAVNCIMDPVLVSSLCVVGVNRFLK